MSRTDYAEVITREMNARITDAESPSIKSFIYRKNDERMYSLLQEFGSENFAIENATKLIANFSDQRYSTHNPCTRVHELIQTLNGLREEEE